MTQPPPTGLSAFVAELRRRHVFRTFLAYGAVAFVVLQAAEIILPAFGMGDWALQLIVVVSVLGLPVVVALAWVYEITPRGIRTTKELDLEAGRKLEEEGSFAPRLALLAVTLLATGTAGLYWVRTSVPAAESGAAAAGSSPSFRPASDLDRDVPVRSLAVLPLESFSPPASDGGTDDGAYFAAGMHEALISQLSRMGSSFRVISRTTVTQYDPAGRSMAQIGEDLGVEGVVEGSVVVDGERVRITVQLIHAPSDTHLWSADYEREMDDLIALQREVATAIADAVLGELDEGGATERLASDAPPETEPEAAVAEMKGRVILSGADRENGAELALAQRHFEEALREDSSYAPALVGLAGSTLMRELATGGVPSPEAVARAGRHARRALEVDPSNSEARDILVVLDDMDLDDMDLEDVRAAVTTDLGARIRALGFERTAVSAVAPAKVGAARTLLSVGRTAEARRLLEEVVRQSPEHVAAWEELERVLVAEGRVAEVVDLRRRRRGALAETPVPDAPSLDALAGRVEAEGPTGYWRWRLDELVARRQAGLEVRTLDLATAHAALGEDAPALAALRSAVTQGDPDLPALRSDPTWDRYRRDPRFRALLGQALDGRRRGSDPGV